MEWLFHNTGDRDGILNMTIDDAMARQRVGGSSTCALRVYGWHPRAISLGWNQSPADIDLELASARSVDVVRRPTGGRAILHSEELTYSVILVSDPVSIGEVYQQISRALLAGIRSLGISAELERSQPHFPSLYRSSDSSLCFVSAARHEIKVDGKKLVGSAQRRYARPDGREVVLQHGSILLGSDHLSVTDFLRFSDDDSRKKAREHLARRTTDLSAILGMDVGRTDIANAIRLGFEDAWGVHMSDATLSDDMMSPTSSSPFHVRRAESIEAEQV